MPITANVVALASAFIGTEVVTACTAIHDEDDPDPNTGLLEVVTVLHEESDVVDLVKRLDVDREILAPALSESRGRGVGARRSCGPCAELVRPRRQTLRLHEMEGMPVLTMPPQTLGRSILHLERALNLAGSAAALVVLAPLFAACAIAIKLDSPGPALFRQRRIGRRDQPFDVFKFRSMDVGTDERKDEIADLNFHGGANESGVFKVRRDPRIACVGRFPRPCSLDELPQLLNILRGDTGLAGPRPLIETEDGQAGALSEAARAHPRADRTLAGQCPIRGMVNFHYLYVTNWSSGRPEAANADLLGSAAGRGAY